VKLGVLISGRGSNLQALIDATKGSGFPAEIAIVVSNVPGAYGLERAARAGIPTLTINHKDHDGRESFERAVDAALRKANIDLLCLAGFMRVLTNGFIDSWPDRIINIHPSLLPSFKGLRVHERAIEAGVRFSGCTVHYVRPAMDSGPIIVQAVVPVFGGDDADTLAARVLEREHAIYPLAVKLIAEGRTRIVDERVLINNGGEDLVGFVNPGC